MHHRWIRLQIERDQFVRLADPNRFENSGQTFETNRIDRALIAGDPDGGPRSAGHDVRAEPELLDDLHDAVDLALRGAAFHDNEHGATSAQPGESQVFRLAREVCIADL